MKVDFFDLGVIPEADVTFVVMVARCQDRWIMVRHRERTTWEIPGGHREPLESLDQAARRELYEETGAVEFSITPVCGYGVTRGTEQSFGQLYLADVTQIGLLPPTEIAEIKRVAELPADCDLTYPLIQPLLNQRVLQYLWEKEKTKG